MQGEILATAPTDETSLFLETKITSCEKAKRRMIRNELPPQYSQILWLVMTGIFVFALGADALASIRPVRTSASIVDSYIQIDNDKKTRVAILGNSMVYYNDMPRLLERLSLNLIEQKSCMHALSTLTSLLITGNGMYEKFSTKEAFLETTPEGFDIFDFGDCTVPQLLFGVDERLAEQVHSNNTGQRHLKDVTHKLMNTFLGLCRVP